MWPCRCFQHGRLKRARQGVSAITASIILIAVAIALSVATVGWVFGLFGAYTQRAQIIVMNDTLTPTGTLRVSFKNVGGVADTVTSVQIGTEDLSIPADDAERLIPSNAGQKTITFTDGGSFQPGQILTYRVMLMSGTTLIRTVRVSSATSIITTEAPRVAASFSISVGNQSSGSDYTDTYAVDGDKHKLREIELSPSMKNLTAYYDFNTTLNRSSITQIYVNAFAKRPGTEDFKVYIYDWVNDRWTWLFNISNANLAWYNVTITTDVTNYVLSDGTIQLKWEDARIYPDDIRSQVHIDYIEIRAEAS